ncbi:MAG TPA: sigma factor, partial [Actinomycetes bacterium]|nr:sigma factor [Actinomycetes bacterium]
MPNDPRQGLASASTPVRLPNVQSFASLFRSEYPRLVGIAWGLTGSREAAEDVVQDVMLTVYTQWDDLPAMSSPEAYLRRATVNRATSVLRRAAAEARALLRSASSTPR